MYKLKLIQKYLFKRRIAWVALVAVTLCTAMVLVVVSVMGGWLRVFEGSFHGMTGDVVISADSLGGFPYYQEMIDGIRKLPDAAGAVPVVRTGGLINIDNRDVQMVQVIGYTPDIGTVNDWPGTLHLDQHERKEKILAATTQPGISDSVKSRLLADVKQLPFALHPNIHYEDYVSVRARDHARNNGGIIVSTALVGMRHDKSAEANELRYDLYRFPCTLTLVPVTGGEPISMESVQPIGFWIVDDSKSQIWQLDNNNVYISFSEAQRDLRMAANGDDPARCSEVQIKAKPGVDLDKLKTEVLGVTDQIRKDHDFPMYYDFKCRPGLSSRERLSKRCRMKWC